MLRAVAWSAEPGPWHDMHAARTSAELQLRAAVPAMSSPAGAAPVWSVVVAAPAVKGDEISAGVAEGPAAARVAVVNTGADFGDHAGLAGAVDDLTEFRSDVRTHDAA